MARNDVSYLEAVARHRGISVALVEDAIDASVDAPNSKATGEELERLSRLISMLNNVEVIATSAFTSSSSSASPPLFHPLIQFTLEWIAGINSGWMNPD